VIRKLIELIIEAFKANHTPIHPISTLPIKVYFNLVVNGVIIAHPGIKSLLVR
jgi:hypothetical protein